MQENIIGYLLGALDDDEMAQFEAELDWNEDLQLRVKDAARSLHILNFDAQDEEPPAGLVESTCRQIQTLTKPAVKQGRSRKQRRLREQRELAYDSGAWSLFDIIVAAAVLFVACLLFFPAISNSRMHTQIAVCQDNLRNIGNALIQCSMSDPREMFPEIPKEGNAGVAGVYGPLLLELGLITDDNKFYCPSSSGFENSLDRHIPRLDEVMAAQGPAVRCLQEQMGGDYNYTLGYMRNGQPSGVRNQNRMHYVIMADSPICESQPSQRSFQHRNVLFEYGGVRMIPYNMSSWKGDGIYEDAHGRVQAGVNDNDAVVGPSASRPMP